MNRSEKLADLRHSLTRYGLPSHRPAVPLGHAGADAVLGGGLKPGALHEILGGDWGAGGFAALLALKMAGSKPLFWVRPDYEALEYGAISPGGLLELGGDPARLLLLKTPDVSGALAAAHDILTCPHVGALVLELSANPKSLDLVASRRLALAAAESGVTIFLLRAHAQPLPGAALTRWLVTSAPSQTRDDDWGNPRFHAQLIRHRAGGLGSFTLQWDCQNDCFRDTAHHGAVAAAIAGRPADAPRAFAL